MRPPTEAASPVVTGGYGSTSTMYRRIVFWTDLTFSRRSQHAYAVKQMQSTWCSLLQRIELMSQYQYFGLQPPVAT
jgi:hypothetical protein